MLTFIYLLKIIYKLILKILKTNKILKMNVEKTIDLGNGHKIDIGFSSWDNNKKSIRNRYPTSKGGFSPRSSSELPIEDITQITIESINNDLITKDDLKNIIFAAINKL